MTEITDIAEEIDEEMGYHGPVMEDRRRVGTLERRLQTGIVTIVLAIMMWVAYQTFQTAIISERLAGKIELLSSELDNFVSVARSTDTMVSERCSNLENRWTTIETRLATLESKASIQEAQLEVWQKWLGGLDAQHNRAPGGGDGRLLPQTLIVPRGDPPQRSLRLQSR